MSEHITESDRRLLDMLDSVCWECVKLKQIKTIYDRDDAYLDAKLALEEVLIELTKAKLREKNSAN